MLESAAISDAALCVRILSFLQVQLTSIKPQEFATTQDLPLPSIAENAFDAVHRTLLRIASNSSAQMLIRFKCLELLLMLSVARATLSVLLSVLKVFGSFSLSLSLSLFRSVSVSGNFTFFALSPLHQSCCCSSLEPRKSTSCLVAMAFYSTL